MKKKKFNKEQEHALAIWCEEQKSAYYRGELMAWQIKKLEEIPGWDWKLTNEQINLKQSINLN